MRSGDFQALLINKSENGDFTGNDWARGFFRAFLLSDTFDKIIRNEICSVMLKPILAIAGKHKGDLQIVNFMKGITEEMRREFVLAMSGCTARIYETMKDNAKSESAIQNVKIGRNDPCYCGSGKKYKKCCMNRTLH